MKFVAGKDDLLNGIRIVERATVVKGLQPVLANVLIETTGSNQIKLSATDFDLSITTLLDAQVEEEGKITLPAKKLGEIISRLQDELVKIELNGSTATITCKNSKFDIAKATSILLFFAVIFALQCVLAYIMIKTKGYANYSDPFYKNYFVIPVGATNDASAVLLALLIIGDQVIPKAKARFLYAALLIFAIFLCTIRLSKALHTDGRLVLAFSIISRAIEKSALSSTKM